MITLSDSENIGGNIQFSAGLIQNVQRVIFYFFSSVYPKIKLPY